jgi:hypothetical protein
LIFDFGFNLTVEELWVPFSLLGRDEYDDHLKELARKGELASLLGMIGRGAVQHSMLHLHPDKFVGL